MRNSHSYKKPPSGKDGRAPGKQVRQGSGKQFKQGSDKQLKQGSDKQFKQGSGKQVKQGSDKQFKQGPGKPPLRGPGKPVARGTGKPPLRESGKPPAKGTGKPPLRESGKPVTRATGKPPHRAYGKTGAGSAGSSRQGRAGSAGTGEAALIRLNKYVANSGICSRRDADKLISAGLISVNGKTVTELGSKVSPGDDVRYNGERIRNEKKVYLLLNKPKDYVTTTEDPRERKTVMTLVKQACPERIYPVGRLDRNTTGVLLFTNDGELAKKLTHPSYNKKKIYHVFLDKGVTANDLHKLANGIDLEDGFIQPDEISYVSNENKREIGLEIHSGRNRIVRRMFESLGYRVTKLDRVYFAGLTKKNLPRGKWRFLTEKEISRLRMNAYE